jgi:Quinolinate synthetase A protein
MTTLAVASLQEEVRSLARERGAVILAHNYQLPEVQDVADYVGDSLGLSRQAAATDADAIVFCGVHFMAETAAILCPHKTVLIPDPDAGCSLAASITAEQLRSWKSRVPRRGGRLLRQHDRRGEGRERLLLHPRQHQSGDRRDPGRQADPVPARHVPRHLARARHPPRADDLARRMPRARRHPPRRHRALADGRARRRAARPPRMRLRQPVHGLRQRAHPHPNPPKA